MPLGPRGPAAARNFGAASAAGDILVFLDADVAVYPDTLSRMAAWLETHADVDAVFGSYDASPDHPSLVSQYRNLLHHYVHQHSSGDAETFWAGCGAVRRSVFVAAGGFDERHRRASIEDIEFGDRLRAAGRRIALRPEIQVTHLKRWTLRQMVRSDIVDRAVPWTRLILERRRLPNTLNVTMRNRVSAGAAWTMLAALAASPAVPVVSWAALLGLAVLAGLNGRFYRFLLARRGLGVAAVGAGLHTAYLLYSSAVFVALAGHAWMARLPGRLFGWSPVSERSRP